MHDHARTGGKLQMLRVKGVVVFPMVSNGKESFNFLKVLGRLYFVDGLNSAPKSAEVGMSRSKVEGRGDPLGLCPVVIVNEAHPISLGFCDRLLASIGQPRLGFEAIVQRYSLAPRTLSPLHLELRRNDSSIVTTVVIDHQNFPGVGSG